MAKIQQNANLECVPETGDSFGAERTRSERNVERLALLSRGSSVTRGRLPLASSCGERELQLSKLNKNGVSCGRGRNIGSGRLVAGTVWF